MKLGTNRIASRTFFLSVIALAALAGCGGSSSGNGATPPTDAGGTDSAVKDSGPKTDGAAGGSIAGSLAITVTVLQNQMGILGENMPFNAAGARIELPGNPAKCAPAYCIEAKTDATGVVTFMVDPSQGPYDITIANTGFGAVSILAVTAPVPDSVILYPLGGTPAYQTFNATGTIDGGQNPTDVYQLDAWDWNTVVQSGSSYTTTFQVTPGVATPLPGAAMDAIPDSGTIVNGYLTASNPRTAGNTEIDINFPTTAIPADLAVVNIAWPSSGFNAGSNVKSIGNLAAGAMETYLGNGFIEQTIASEPGAAMFVGSVVVSLPTGNMSTATIQSYSSGTNANLKPDIVEALLSSQAATATTVAPTDFNTIVELHGADLANGAMVTVPTVRSFTFTNTTSLDTLQFAADSDYKSTQISISDTSAGATTIIWTLYAPGGTVATRGLPRLPTSLGGATELSGDVSMLGAALSGTTYTSATTSGWFVSGDDSNISYQTTTIVNAVAPTVGTY